MRFFCRGDYRTGKRLNLRKLIPFIASNYRKDKIWLRRTRRAKRNYSILLAVDDSSSMSDNYTKQVLFHSNRVWTLNDMLSFSACVWNVDSFGTIHELLGSWKFGYLQIWRKGRDVTSIYLPFHWWQRRLNNWKFDLWTTKDQHQPGRRSFCSRT